MRCLRLGRSLIPVLLASTGVGAFLSSNAHAQASPDPAAPPAAAPTTPAPAPAAAPTTDTPPTTPAASSETEPTPIPPPPHVVDAWELRDRNQHEVPSAGGPSGLLHTASAMTGPASTFRVAFLTDWFKSTGFLCTASYPCVHNGVASTSDSASHIGGTIFASATIIEGLEAYFGARVYANSNNQSDPELLQVLGDTTLGGKYVRRIGDSFVHVGGGGEVLFLNGTDGIGLSGASTSLRLRALSTFALDDLPSHIPVRIHLALAYLFDNSAHAIESVEAARTAAAGSPQYITRLERFGLGINRVDRFEVNVGVEGLLAEDKVRPFLEYQAYIPNNRQGFECPNPTSVAGGNSDSCLKLQGFGAVPSQISFGLRYYPFEDGGMRGLSFMAAFDIGVTGTSTFISELAPQAPYTAWLGIALSTDALTKPPVIIEKQVEKRVEVATGPNYVTVKGTVHELGTNTPIPNAIVAYVGTSRPSLASAADGSFGDEVPAGTYQLSVKADGYKDGTCGGVATVAKKGAPPAPAPVGPGAPPAATAPAAAGGGVLELDCGLEALPKVGTAVLTITDHATLAGMPGVEIVLIDNSGLEKRITTDATGAVRAEGLNPGTWTVTVDVPGYLHAKQPFEIFPRQETREKVLVRPEPKEKDRLVVVSATEVKIKQQVQFAFDRADILPESIPLLEEVADVIIRTPRIHKIQVQGHTDNVGGKEHNQLLSEQRAESVRAFLVRAGVDPTRLEIKGYGDTKPIGPNATEGGRSKNRRVQFVIEEQDPAPKGGK